MTPLAQTHLTVDTDNAAGSAVAPELARDVVRFPNGLPGFEACRGFVLMTAESLGPVQCLKAVEGPAASFLVIDPRRVMPDYRCELSPADMHRLGVTNPERIAEDLLWLVLVTIEVDGTISVNLRAPVVINPQGMIGQQVVPYHCVYPIRHVVAAAGE
jgi:flagellar assembly factor FliW